jgi:hypothetical protein
MICRCRRNAPYGALAGLTMGLLSAGCITVRVGGDAPPKAAYTVDLPRDGWQPLPDVEAARAFRSADSGAVLGVSTACDGAAADGFEPLLAAVTSAIGRRDVVAPAAPLDGTSLPARITEVRGAVDDHPVQMVAIVLKSDACVYDVTLTGRSLSDTDRAAAIDVARSVRETGGA